VKIFDKTLVKLTVLYLAIIMAISLFFSINLYRSSVQELNRSLVGPSIVIQKIPRGLKGFPNLREQLMEERLTSYQDAKDRIVANLVFINLIILIGGGLMSYFLALKTLKPIKEAHEAQKRFTADASHELRTPIAAMQSEIEVTLMDPKLNLNKAKDQLNSNLEELAKLTALTKGLLELAQLENNDICKENIEVNEFVQSAVDQIMPIAEQKKVLINYKISDGLKLCGDRSSLREVIAVLLDNAVKYSPPNKEVMVKVSAHQSDVIIKVTDHGPGINKKDLDNIFDRFYRSDKARDKNQNSGYGLGLSIAKKIVGLHNGEISARSQINKGSTFIVRLPIKK
jgi:signal transduction histidine kinase